MTTLKANSASRMKELDEIRALKDQIRAYEFAEERRQDSNKFWIWIAASWAIGLAIHALISWFNNWY